MMYAAPNRRTTHRLARLDVPTPSWMRAPGECPGMFALESAMDELAVATGIDPVELRIRNEPEVDPESGHPFSQPQPGRVPARGCGAVRLGGARPAPGVRREGRWLVGTGVASSTYPASQPAVVSGRVGHGRRALHGAISAGRHRHRRAHRTHADRRRRARRRRRPGRS